MRTTLYFSIIILISFGLIYSQKKSQIENEDFNQIIFEEALIQNQAFGPNDPHYLSFQNQVTSIKAIYPLKLNNGRLAIFYFRSLGAPKLYVTLSSDDGVTWYATNPIQQYTYTQETQQLSAIETSNGRLVLIASPSSGSLSGRALIFYSDDLGTTWSGPVNLGGGIFGSVGKNFDMTLTANGNIICTYQDNTNSYFFRRSTDNGLTWSDEIPIPTNSLDSFGKVIELAPGQLGFIYSSIESSVYRINIKTSNNNGVNWSSPQIIYSDTAKINSMKVVKTGDNKVYIVFENNIRKTFLTGLSTQFNYTFTDIHYIQSTNNGASWSTVNQFTKYKGRDDLVSVGWSPNQPYVIFNSCRFDSLETGLKFWYGQIGIVNDNNAPPRVLFSQITTVQINVPIFFNAIIVGTSQITQAQLNLIRNGVQIPPITIYDDGLHNDGLANDNVYGNTLGSFNNIIRIDYRIQVNDAASNSLSFPGGTILLSTYQRTTHLFDVNRFKIPIANDGIIANVFVNNQSGGFYDEGSIVYSGGFLLSGYRNNQFWTGLNATASRMGDFLPGVFDTTSTQIQNQMFIVNVTDPPFGTAWQNWVNAVNLGADYYDGNKDGIYNPVDLNGNGQWDPNEDRPGLIGNRTTFFVFSDKLPSLFRRFTNTSPVGIEIRQTVYAFSNNEFSLNNVVFVKYDILNKSGSNLDSLIFSAWADPDIGFNYDTDLICSDSIRQSIITYKSNIDPTFGSNPPAFFHSLMQGPVVYIPGETFIDLNNNGIFDPGVDTPIDTAYNIRGQVLGIDTLPGAKNQKVISSNQFLASSIMWGSPTNINEVRYSQIGGMMTRGEIINPCSVGTVVGVNCNQVNPKFIFSGDPQTNFGWLDNLPFDKKTVLSVGPFNLKNNNSNKIVLAYVGSRGTDPKNSVTVGKENLNLIRQAYWRNFPVIVSVKDDIVDLPQEFILHQNYPNPFNPSTKISWQSPVSGHHTIKVFDVLGKEVTTLVDEWRDAGRYSVEFNASELASGVYIYQLRINDPSNSSGQSYLATKKLILIK